LSSYYLQGSWSDVRGHSFVLQLTLLLSAILYFALGVATAVPVISLIRIGLGKKPILGGVRDTNRTDPRIYGPKVYLFPFGFP
jgi:hypothetical protein